MGNLFFTDKNPAVCAGNLPDMYLAPVLKCIARIKSTFLQSRGFVAPYKPVKWASDYIRWLSESYANAEWLYEYAQALQSEYSRAYEKTKVLKSFKIVVACLQLAKKTNAPKWKAAPWTPPPAIFARGFDGPREIKGWLEFNDIAKNRAYLNWKVQCHSIDEKNPELYSWSNRPTPNFIDLLPKYIPRYRSAPMSPASVGNLRFTSKYVTTPFGRNRT